MVEKRPTTAAKASYDKIDLVIILFILFLWEWNGILNELRYSIITDWTVILAPLLWINISIPFAYYLLKRLLIPETKTYIRTGRLANYLHPDFTNLRRVLSLGRVKALWGVIFLAYFISYAYLQGIIVIDPLGRLEPRWLVFSGTVGYGPVVVWSPGGFVGLVLRPYLLSAAFAISLGSSLALTLFILLLISRRGVRKVMPAPFTGFAVLCPSCFTSPAAAVITASFSAVSPILTAPIPLFQTLLLISTTLLIISLILIWIAISLLSRIPLVSDSR